MHWQNLRSGPYRYFESVQRPLHVDPRIAGNILYFSQNFSASNELLTARLEGSLVGEVIVKMDNLMLVKFSATLSKAAVVFDQ
mmetsp:Transcript_8286/g.14206  ORF Transcript_8286/g.14206 Transcript_8286/m.14206 type:complete len:83 (-) Transcript_8286:248-496(-)